MPQSPNTVKSFYFIRHGQTDANVADEFCGCKWDIDLNETGHEQAKLAAAALLPIAATIRTVCHSPMRRACQTKDLILPSLPNASVIEVPDLREWDLGDWDHQKYDVIPPDRDFRECNPPNGETHDIFHERVCRALAFCLEQPGEVLIVAHGAVGGSLLRKFSIENQWVDNATVYRFDLTATPRLIKI